MSYKVTITYVDGEVEGFLASDSGSETSPDMYCWKIENDKGFDNGYFIVPIARIKKIKEEYYE